MSLDWIGYAAAVLTALSFIPQAIGTISTRNSRGISGWMYLLFTAGVALWLVYGISIELWSVIAVNSVTLALVCTVLLLKPRFD